VVLISPHQKTEKATKTKNQKTWQKVCPKIDHQKKIENGKLHLPILNATLPGPLKTIGAIEDEVGEDRKRDGENNRHKNLLLENKRIERDSKDKRKHKKREDKKNKKKNNRTTRASYIPVRSINQLIHPERISKENSTRTTQKALCWKTVWETWESIVGFPFHTPRISHASIHLY
jgi:hypothetical protein